MERVAKCATICPAMKMGGCCCAGSSSGDDGSQGERESGAGEKMIESGTIEVCVEDGQMDVQN